MLLKQLSIDDRRDFLCIAELLSIADKPVTRVGKGGLTIAEDIASQVLMGSVLSMFMKKAPTRTIPAGTISSIQRNERESAVMAELISVCEKGAGRMPDGTSEQMDRKGIEWALVKRIGRLSLDKAEEPAARTTVALEVLREVLKGKKALLPSVPKVMLFELMLFALSKGSISSVEWQLLNEFRHHHHLENYIFDDLLERAECTYREAQKTLAIILE